MQIADLRLNDFADVVLRTASTCRLSLEPLGSQSAKSSNHLKSAFKILFIRLIRVIRVPSTPFVLILTLRVLYLYHDQKNHPQHRYRHRSDDRWIYFFTAWMPRRLRRAFSDRTSAVF